MPRREVTLAEMSRIDINEDEIPKINAMLERNWALIEQIRKCNGDEMIDVLGPPVIERKREWGGIYIEVTQKVKVEDSVTEVAGAA